MAGKDMARSVCLIAFVLNAFSDSPYYNRAFGTTKRMKPTRRAADCDEP
jgi:hypothetical protein